MTVVVHTVTVLPPWVPARAAGRGLIDRGLAASLAFDDSLLAHVRHDSAIDADRSQLHAAHLSRSRGLVGMLSGGNGDEARGQDNSAQGSHRESAQRSQDVHF